MTVSAVPEIASPAYTTELLAYLPSPPQGVWQLGPFPLRAYAICIIIGIIVAIWWGEKRWQQRGGQGGAVLDVAVFAVPFGLIGGRLYHVATDWEKYFGADGNPVDALKIYQGGLGIWGAVALGGVGAWIACRLYKIPLPALADAIAPPILLAQAIGRLGNWFNQELYGRPTDLPWGLEIYKRFTAADDTHGVQFDMLNGSSSGEVMAVVHPTFLYELLWNVLIVLLLVWADRRFRLGHGRLFALYVAGYCFGRFFVELLRDDPATEIAGIRINSFTSVLVFLCAVAYFLFATKGRESAGQLAPGGHRPWPWQLGALRKAGAAGLVAAVAAEESSGDENSSGDAGADEPVAGEDASEDAESGVDRGKRDADADSARTDGESATAGTDESDIADPESEHGETETDTTATESDDMVTDAGDADPEQAESDAGAEQDPEVRDGSGESAGSRSN